MGTCRTAVFPAMSSIMLAGAPKQPELYYADTSYGGPFVKDPDVEWFRGRYLMYYSVNRGKAG